MFYLNILGVEECQFGGSSLGEDFRVSRKDDPGLGSMPSSFFLHSHFKKIS